MSEITTQEFRVVSFNVAGIKNVLNYHPWNQKKSFEHMFEVLDADIVCFQETKVQSRDLTKQMAIIEGFESYFTFPTNKKGYSGVAIYVRKSIPVFKAEQGLTGWLSNNVNDSSGTSSRNATDNIGGYPAFIDEKSGRELDAEGRAIVLDIGSCVIIGLYCPANSQGDRHEYKQAFMEALDIRIRNLIEIEKRQVIVMGDINVARELQDSAEAKQDWFKANLLVKESDPIKFREINKDALESWKTSSISRKIVNSWVGEDPGSSKLLTDTARSCQGDRSAMYTCWNMKVNARPANFGSRVDYIFVSGGFECLEADILPELQGSDHCPIMAKLRISVDKLAKRTKRPKLCTGNLEKFKTSNILSMFGMGVGVKDGKAGGNGGGSSAKGGGRVDDSVKRGGNDGGRNGDCGEQKSELEGQSNELRGQRYELEREMGEQRDDNGEVNDLRGSIDCEATEAVGFRASISSATTDLQQSTDGGVTVLKEVIGGDAISLKWSTDNAISNRNGRVNDPKQSIDSPAIRLAESDRSQRLDQSDRSQIGKQSDRSPRSGKFNRSGGSERTGKSHGSERSDNDINQTNQSIDINKPIKRSNDNFSSKKIIKKSKYQQKTLISFFSKKEIEPQIEPQTTKLGDTASIRTMTKLSTMEASKQWNDIFTPKSPPLCSGHGEPCELRITKKNGPNKGKYFWSCSRPTGADEHGLNSSTFRCNFFKWA